MQNLKRRRKHYQDEKPDRWLISYADFITLLFAFFVVMYSISSVNEGKYRVLSDSITSAFKPGVKTLSIESDKPINPLNNGNILVPKSNSKDATQNLILHKMAQEEAVFNEARNLELILKKLKYRFLPQINNKTMHIVKNGLQVEIEIQANILFRSGSVQPTAGAWKIISEIASNLKKYNGKIDVAGFTDNVPVRSNNIPSNWELSAARASRIVRYLVDHGVKPEHLSATGFGEYRPIATNDTETGRRKNRRIAIIISPDYKDPISGQYDRLNYSLDASKIELPANILPPFSQD